jgi:hypothetical protein
LDLCARTSTRPSKEASPNFDEAVDEAVEADGFSILRRSSAEPLVVESGRNDRSVLEVGQVAGIPYFSEESSFVTVDRVHSPVLNAKLRSRTWQSRPDLHSS